MMDTYEKKYKGALARCKWLLSEGMISRIAATDLFRELMDNDSDNIRKEIINIFHSLAEGKIPVDINYADIFTWLEKQNEQKPTLPKWKYKKDNTTLLKDSLVLNKCGHMAKLSSGAIVSDVWVLDYAELAKLPKEELEEQSEQKPADEPKFKIGDYIERKDGVGCHTKIIFVGGNFYGCEKLIYPEDESPFFEFMFENQDEFRVSSDFQQKLAWNEEDEEYDGKDYGIDGLWHAMNILEKTLGKVNGYQTDDGFLSHQCAITAVKKLYKQKPTETVKWSAQEEYCICELEAMVKEAWRKAENVHNDVTIKKMQELMFFLKTLNPSKKP